MQSFRFASIAQIYSENLQRFNKIRALNQLPPMVQSGREIATSIQSFPRHSRQVPRTSYAREQKSISSELAMHDSLGSAQQQKIASTNPKAIENKGSASGSSRPTQAVSGNGSRVAASVVERGFAARVIHAVSALNAPSPKELRPTDLCQLKI